MCDDDDDDASFAARLHTADSRHDGNCGHPKEVCNDGHQWTAEALLLFSTVAQAVPGADAV